MFVRLKPVGSSWRPSFIRSCILTGLQGQGGVSRDTTSSDGDECQIPLVPKMRDPNAVLKALASTVSPLKHPFVMGRSLADPLVPKNRRQMMEFLMAETAGRKAAMEVIRRNPKIFPAFQPVPDIQETSEPPPPSGLNEENLKRLILSRRSERSLRVYTRLKDKGETVSLATQNLLLKLLAYYGTGCTFTPSTENPPEASKVVPIQDYSMALSHSQYKVIWNEDCEAEKLFAEMEHKDGRTYSAMIEGLMKFKQHKRGMELFNEAREKGLQLTVDAYNSILQSLPSTKDNKIWSKANSILIEMTKQPAVMLDVSTINAMLGVACATGISSRNYGMEVIREAVYLEIKLNLTSFIELLRCFSNHGDYTVMYSIMDYIEENPDIVTVQNPTDVYFFTVAINFVRLLQDSDLAYRLKQHAMKDNWYLVRSLDYFFNSYLSTMCGSNLVRFMEEYESIVPTLFIPKDWLFTIFFKQCAVHKAPDIALRLWKSFLKLRINTTDVTVFHRLAVTFMKSTNPLDVKEYVETMNQIWKKLEFLHLNPTGGIISASIKILLMNGQHDEAWQHYELFKKYNQTPTFIALTALLKSEYHMSRDFTKVLEIFEELIKLGHVLPSNFVRDICIKGGISAMERNHLVERFRQNSLKRNQETSKLTNEITNESISYKEE